MECCSRSDADATLQPPSVTIARPIDVEFLGKPSSADQSSLRSETESNVGRPTGKINVKNVLQLLDFQNYRCALTGRSLTPDEASLDHVVPVRDGGEHVIENTQVLHRDVNRAKSILSNQQFLDLCCEVAKHIG